jgi:IMP dehydrogenase/GMP reductase
MSLSPIDLISSSSYPIPAQLDRGQRAAANANVLYGGLSLLPYDGSTPTPTMEKPKSKRSTTKKSSAKPEDDNKVSKRKRGRPRVLDKDENAAEVCLSTVLEASYGSILTVTRRDEEPKFDSLNGLIAPAKKLPSHH